YAVLLAGCTYAFSTFFPSTIKPINKSVELNETQNNNGITLTLYRVSYNHDWQNQYISVTFKIENHGDFPATLNGSKDLNSTNNILLLKNTKEHFPLVGYSWMDDLGKEEDNGITY